MHRKSSYVNEKYGSLYGGQTILHKCICALLRFFFYFLVEVGEKKLHWNFNEKAFCWDSLNELPPLQTYTTTYNAKYYHHSHHEFEKIENDDDVDEDFSLFLRVLFTPSHPIYLMMLGKRALWIWIFNESASVNCMLKIKIEIYVGMK